MVLSEKQKEIKAIAEEDLVAFVGLVAPERVLGHCHIDLLRFFMQDDHYQLCIWPRGHQKSTMIAYWAAWKIIKDPTVTILYASATGDLAEKQITFIKNILTSPIVRKYWPDLIHEDISKRSLWRSMEFSVDDPRRSEEGIRYPTMKAVGLGGNITGFHADVLLLDDIVVRENAYTKAGRRDVASDYSLFNSILNPDGYTKAVGTRYHPDDLYNDMMKMKHEVEDEQGNIIDEAPLYKVLTAVVEYDGQFLWPRQKRKDGKWFGFNSSILKKIRANYLDTSQFFAQYYNDPSDPENKRISNFEYYDRSQLRKVGKRWYVGVDRPLNVFAAIDLAATITERSDYTAIVVAGIDSEHNIYVLDIARFKTNKLSVMTDELVRLYSKWHFLRLSAEVNAQQGLAVEQIKQFLHERGIFFTIIKKAQTLKKEIRIMSILEPRYAEGKVYHYRGGLCQVLEDELQSSKPPHDDISDALTAVVEIAVPPSNRQTSSPSNVVNFHPKFGGIA